MPHRSRPHQDRHAATLADVGREAGVSAMAASAVLNGARTSSRISPETRDRILEAARRLKYRPNAAARALAERRMNTLGVAACALGDDLNQYFLEVFNGVLEGASRAGQNTTVFSLPDWHGAEERIAQFCDGRIDGLILLAPFLPAEAVQRFPEHTPLVSIHSDVELPGVTNLESAEEEGAFEMVKHMLALGHRRILHVAGPQRFNGARRRVEGFLRAFAAAGLPAPEDAIIEGNFTADTGRSVFADWLRDHRGQPLPDALFCANDATALGCLDVLLHHGFRVPEDISVVGFDDTLLARTTQLTTVRQPLRSLGHKAVDNLLARIDAKLRDCPYRSPSNVVLPTDLVVRTTLATPRATPRLIPG